MGKSGTTRKRERSKERKEKKRMSKQGPNPLMEWLQENQTAFYLYFVLFAAVFMVTCVLLSRQSEGANMRIMSINVGAWFPPNKKRKPLKQQCDGCVLCA